MSLDTSRTTRVTRSSQPHPPVPTRAPSRASTPVSPETSRKPLPARTAPTPIISSSNLPSRTPSPPTPVDMSDFKSVKLNTENLKFSGCKADYRAWRDIIDLYMIGNPKEFPTDQIKIAFTLSWMSGNRNVLTWASNQQTIYTRSGTWPSWTEFQKILEDQYGDPAAEQQAREYLLHYRQGDAPARSFFDTLELWFTLANITDKTEAYNAAKRLMNPRTRSALVMAGFPSTYKELRDKLCLLEDEERKMGTMDARKLDSRLFEDSGVAAARQYKPAQSTFIQVQGQAPAHANTGGRMSYTDIMKMPKGTRPKPKNPCWTCKDLNRGDAFHWRDECPYKREQATGRSYPNPRRTSQVSRPAQAKPPQEPRRLPPLGPAIARPRGPRQNPRFNRQAQEGEPNAMASVSALLASMSENDRRSILVEEAKRLAL